MKKNQLVNAVMATLVGTGLAVSTTSLAASHNHKKNVEKCYGISKAKMNDCGTPQHACAGQSKVDASKQEWIYVLKGNCKRIAGGSLEPEKS